MPRKARLDMPGALHHIMVRGINKTDIFYDDDDRSAFLTRLGAETLKSASTIYAFALMNNHVHILFKSGEVGITSVMRRLLTWYAIYFNRRHNRSGHLFENRYKSILCDEERYLLTLVRYIHLNPMRAGLVKNMQQLADYRWCGHGIIMGRGGNAGMDTTTVLSMFGRSEKSAVAGYEEFVKSGIACGHQPELTGGGLVRSKGGWSAVISARKKKEEMFFDERMLGDSEFISKVMKNADERHWRQFKMRAAGITITDIVRQECAIAGISAKELASGGRRQAVTEARKKIVSRSLTELGSTYADIARQVGVSTVGIWQIAQKMVRE